MIRAMQSIRVPSLLALLLCLLSSGCGTPEDGASESWSVPADLHVRVLVAGIEAPPIDAARLAGLAPAYEDDERRAWRLDAFFGEGYERDDAVLEAETRDGTRSRFVNPSEIADGEVLVLSVNRRGWVFVAQVDAADPFPRYHGRGGNRGRTTGDDRRLKDVVLLGLRHGGAGAGHAGLPEDQRPMLQLRARVDGTERIWTEDDLLEVDALSVPGDSGQGTRDAWSVRAVLEALIGPDAVLQGVEGEGGGAAAIDAAAWRDDARIPVLRLNRRGQFKFHWVTPDLAPLEGDEVRLVKALVISTG